MKHISKLFATLGVASTLCTGAVAGTIDFENMPQAYWFYGGQQNFGNYWQGVNFGPASTILEDQVYGYNSSGYPPHSGHAVLFSISIPYIDAIFDVPVDKVDLWYTSSSPFVVDAYDINNVLLTSVSAPPNIGTSSPIGVTWATKDIKKVVMHDSGNFFTIDDFSAEFLTGNPRVPEAVSTLGALLMAMGGLSFLRRK